MIIYPVGDGTKANFENLWYVAQGFGAPTDYGFHEAADINLKTGGDTDLGQPINAISDFEVLYYHVKSHQKADGTFVVPTFGIHYVYKITGPFGTRWIHCAHNQSLEFSTTITGKGGQKLSTLGKSGTTAAHLHFAVWKVDPALNGGIDQIANDVTELNQKWEDPIAFLNTWSQYVEPPAPAPALSDPTTRLDFKGIQAFDGAEVYNVLELGTVSSKLIAKDLRIKELETKIDNAKQALS